MWSACVFPARDSALYKLFIISSIVVVPYYTIDVRIRAYSLLKKKTRIDHDLGLCDVSMYSSRGHQGIQRNSGTCALMFARNGKLQRHTDLGHFPFLFPLSLLLVLLRWLILGLWIISSYDVIPRVTPSLYMLTLTGAEVSMLCGNLAAILSGAVLTIVISLVTNRQQTADVAHEIWENTRDIDNPPQSLGLNSMPGNFTFCMKSSELWCLHSKSLVFCYLPPQSYISKHGNSHCSSVRLFVPYRASPARV